MLPTGVYLRYDLASLSLDHGSEWVVGTQPQHHNECSDAYEEGSRLSLSSHSQLPCQALDRDVPGIEHTTSDLRGPPFHFSQVYGSG